MEESGFGRIFVSYSRKDREVADVIVRHLEASGFSTWIDRSEILPGQTFVTRINEGLLEASYLLLLVSPNSLESRWVTAEWAYALDEKSIVLIPLLIAPCELPPLLRTVLHIDLVGDPERGLEQLVDFLRHERDTVAEPKLRTRGQPERLLAGATRRELRIVAKTCIDEVKLQDLLFDWDIDRGSLAGTSHHQRILHLLQNCVNEGQLEMFAEWMEQEAAQCVRHQLSRLRSG